MRNAREGTLAYRTKPVEDVYLDDRGGQETNGRSSWTGQDGTAWRVVGQFATPEAAQKRQTELEAEKLAWTVFKVETPSGGREFAVRRAPKEHPSRLEKPDGSTWRVAKRCRTEADARVYLARLESRAAKEDDGGVSTQGRPPLNASSPKNALADLFDKEDEEGNDADGK